MINELGSVRSLNKQIEDLGGAFRVSKNKMGIWQIVDAAGFIGCEATMNEDAALWMINNHLNSDLGLPFVKIVDDVNTAYAEYLDNYSLVLDNYCEIDDDDTEIDDDADDDDALSIEAPFFEFKFNRRVGDSADEDRSHICELLSHYKATDIDDKCDDYISDDLDQVLRVTNGSYQYIKDLYKKADGIKKNMDSIVKDTAFSDYGTDAIMRALWAAINAYEAAHLAARAAFNVVPFSNSDAVTTAVVTNEARSAATKASAAVINISMALDCFDKTIKNMTDNK